MTPERLQEIRETVMYWRAHGITEGFAGELLDALETERARLDTLAKLRPGELFDALSDARGLRAVLDERIAESRQ